jgi:hypothetical protein
LGNFPEAIWKNVNMAIIQADVEKSISLRPKAKATPLFQQAQKT